MAIDPAPTRLHRRSARYVILTLLGGALALVAFGVSSLPRKAPENGTHHGDGASDAPAPAPGTETPAPSAAAAYLRYLAIAGGSEPSLTQVSLEQDLALAQRVLPGPGRSFFGGGPGTLSVQALDNRAAPAAAAPADGLRLALGDFFSPRNDRRTTYRAARIRAEPALESHVLDVLRGALEAGDRALLLYVAAHGEQGESPRDNWIALWAGGALSVQTLAGLHDAHPRRPLRAVIASCFSGGFAELAFADADSERGPATAPRCGLFAGTWDQETSGCDPNPDRRAQEGYSLHFLHALAGEDRHGERIAGLDLDGDGQISLLEAHTRARIAGRSIDVPTTTSERYLRAAVSEPGPPATDLLPEEHAVIAQLGGELGLPSRARVEAAQAQLEARLDTLDARLGEAEDALHQAYTRLAIRLLERWPMLDDPWHPAFERALNESHADIARLFQDSDEGGAYRHQRERVEALTAELLALQVQHARHQRLIRAHETVALAGSLQRRGGPAWQHYRSLLACERGLP